MAVISIINRKGGCGKSTLAAHVAVWISQHGQHAVLADVDFQQTTVQWLQRRRSQKTSLELLNVVTEARNLQRLPGGVQHAVMDTPGGIRGFELSRALQHSDIVLVPVCDSAFDYDASADCIAEMRQHPKIGKGKAQLAVVGLRIQPASVAEGRLRAWAALQDVPYIGSLRSSPLYVHGAAMGLTVFDCSRPGSASDELEDWRPIQHWLDAALVKRNRELQTRKARASFDGQGDSGSGESVSGASTLASRARVLAVRSSSQQPLKLDCSALVAASPLLTAPSRVAGYGPAT